MRKSLSSQRLTLRPKPCEMATIEQLSAACPPSPPPPPPLPPLPPPPPHVPSPHELLSLSALALLACVRENDADLVTLDSSALEGLAVDVIAPALQANTTLTSITFRPPSTALELDAALGRKSTLASVTLVGDLGADFWHRVGAHLTSNSTPSLKCLSFYCSGFGNEVEHLTGLESNTTLTSLSFVSTDIGHDGVRALSVALERNRSITSLTLCHQALGAAANDLATALATNTTLLSLNLAHSRVSPAGVLALFITERCAHCSQLGQQ